MFELLVQYRIQDTQNMANRSIAGFRNLLFHNALGSISYVRRDETRTRLRHLFFKSRTFSRSNAWNGATACKEIVQASSCKKTENLSISLSITINYGEKRKSSYNKQYHCHIWAVDDLRKAQEIMTSGQLWAQSKASNLQTLVSSLYLQVTVQRQWWSL